MLILDKLSELNLSFVLKCIFPDSKIQNQKRFKNDNRTFIVDYFVETQNDKFIFEFDGPTHYQRTSTQIRDLQLENYCNDKNIILVRFPYFFQIDHSNCSVFFSEEIITKYQIDKKIEAGIKFSYESGFHDKKIVYPSDFNSFGWFLFWKQYCSMAENDNFSTMQSIYDSLFNKFAPEHVLGLDYEFNESKVDFYKNYPT